MKEGMIKTISEGNLSLEHSRYRDDFGIWRDLFQIIKTTSSGFRMCYPFLAPIKVKDYSPEMNVLDATDSYTDEEYWAMLRNFKG